VSGPGIDAAPARRFREPVLRRRDWTFPAPAIRTREIVSSLPDAPSARPPLLFVHGAWHGAWCWQEHWMPAAAEAGWECHAVSLRGHGGSERPERFGLVPLRHYEHDVLQAITRLDRPPVLIGHSMGGLVVQHVLERYPAAPAGVLVASVPPGHHGGAIDALVRHDPLALVRALAGREPAPKAATFYGPRTDPDEAARLLARLGPESWLAVQQMVLPRHVARPTQPVLVLGGAEDRLVPPHAVARTARAFGTRAHVFRGMGHQMMLEPDWRAPLTLMLDWLASTLEGPR